MKCTRCGAEIKNGNLYCSSCGEEVQIVSAYKVMEDEFFLDFQTQGTVKRETKDNAGINAARQKKDFYICILTAMIGFFVLLAIAFLMRMNGGVADAEETQPRYLQLVQALADSDEQKAQALLEQGIAETPGELTDRFWMAWLYGKKGEREQQIETLQQILVTDEENVYACRELIRVYVESGDFEGLHEFYDACSGSRVTALFADYLVEAPSIERLSEPVWEGDTLTITAADGLNIYYTLDGSSPVDNGILYYAPIQLKTGVYTLQAAACNEKGYYSAVVSQELTVERHYSLGMPQVTPKSGEYLTPQTIYIHVPEGCSAYYTWNGANPTTASSKYRDGISMPEGNNVLSVIIVDAYGNVSSVQRVNYIYMP